MGEPGARTRSSEFRGLSFFCIIGPKGVIGPHRVVRFDGWCIVASAAIAVGRWSEAEPDDGNGGVAVSGAGGR
jgi:hypothetical protein